VGKVKQQIIDRFIELGGNFIDTANFYTKSHSEKIIATAADKLAGVFAIRWAGSPLSLQIWQVWTGRVLSALPVLLLLLSRGEDCGLWRSPSVSLVLLQARLPPTMAPKHAGPTGGGRHVPCVRNVRSWRADKRALNGERADATIGDADR
jgi:hypothetical protein